MRTLATAPTVAATETPASRNLFDGGLRDGLSDAVPLAIGLLPFALMLGVAIHDSAMSDVAGLALSLTIMAGAAQFATMAIVDAGGSLLAAVVAGLVINARMIMYAAALAPRFEGQPTWFRWAGVHTIVDQTFALVTSRPERDRDWFRGYWLGASGLLAGTYATLIAVGIHTGPILPEGLSLEFAVPIMFLAMLMPGLSDTPRRAAALTAATITAATLGLPHGLGLLLGAVAGAAAGALVAHRATEPERLT